MLAPWAPALALVLAAAQRVVPSWRQVPGDVDWFDGCGYGNEIIRGSISAGLEHNKVRKHVAMCLSHCGPPSCTLKAAETDCDCLKCTMFCLSRGSYVDSCLNNHTYDLCSSFAASIEQANSSSSASSGSCEVNCNGAVRPRLLPAALALSLSLCLSARFL
ncbi:hypothetical protein AK812_SmicGene32381 [Symbiodinium microadriaticum]|uniref:Uncharacterized protein n=1 Tax=Symbiodinium microadriaticum TaxID=2951 RepID=A0A1Q9CU60_SYMMI|nr:hypothetical protein AK812_SmicGene32381 [Symbiodinium microadriaticum]CAE7864819.1 unnamed protein product [Symbiodinium microadriaticum]CAE7940368.1 unnamed protein product [Symbiodinium sp. KB8]